MPALNQWITINGQQYMVTDQGGQLQVLKRAAGGMGKGQTGLQNQRVATSDPVFAQAMQAAGYKQGQVNATTNAASAAIPAAATTPPTAAPAKVVSLGGKPQGRKTPSSIAIASGQQQPQAASYIAPIAFGSKKDAQGNTIYNAAAIGAGAMSEDGSQIWDGGKWISAAENEARKPKPATPAPAPAPVTIKPPVPAAPVAAPAVVKPAPAPAPVSKPPPAPKPYPAPKPPANPAPPAPAAAKPAPVAAPAVVKPAPTPPMPAIANPATPKQDAANPIASAAAIGDAMNARYKAVPVTAGQVNEQAAVVRQGDDPMMARLRQAATGDLDATTAMPALNTKDIAAYADGYGVDFQPLYDQATREFQERQKALMDYLGNIPGGSGSLNAQMLRNVSNYGADLAALKTQNRLGLIDRARQDLTGNIGLAENRRTQGLNVGQYLQGQANRAQDVAQNLLAANSALNENRFQAGLASAERGMDRVTDTTRHLQDLAFQDMTADKGRTFDAQQAALGRQFQSDMTAGQRAHEQSQLNQQGRAALTGSIVQNFLPRLIDQILPPQPSQTDLLNQQLFSLAAANSGLVNEGGSWRQAPQPAPQGSDMLSSLLGLFGAGGQAGGLSENDLIGLLQNLGAF